MCKNELVDALKALTRTDNALSRNIPLCHTMIGSAVILESDTSILSLLVQYMNALNKYSL